MEDHLKSFNTLLQVSMKSKVKCLERIMMVNLMEQCTKHMHINCTHMLFHAASTDMGCNIADKTSVD